jgi:16S rRNA (guanine527-N7)-methyltransferase
MTKRADAIARVIAALRPEAAAHAASLSTFLGLVETWNAKIDLTAARTPAALADVMIADALVMADEALVPHGAHLLDVGSGAGGPAIPLAIARPDVRVTMLEPLGKRVAFLRTAIGSLGLAPRVAALDGRVDLAAPRAPVDCDVASARATFAPNDWRAAGLAIAPRVLVLTTPEDVPEGAPVARRDYRWPGSGAARVLVRFDREVS